jgi:hypothetical protein
VPAAVVGAIGAAPIEASLLAVRREAASRPASMMELRNATGEVPRGRSSERLIEPLPRRWLQAPGEHLLELGREVREIA